MRRVFPLILAFAVSAAAVPCVQAEDTAAAQELRELRQAVQQQGKQIELLAEQVGKLTRALEAQKGVETAKPAEPAPAPTVTTSTIETAKPVPEVAPAAAEPAKSEGIPKAEAVPGTKHVVAKGETLTSIAKHYNISIADLKNANKIDNERKLQIGQILSVPTAKTPEAPDKKENP
jgi:LysM repeat protein